MSTYNVSVSAIAGFTSLEEARVVGQAVKKLMESGSTHLHGAFGITQVPGLISVPLVKVVPDYSKMVVGSQESEAEASALAKEIDKRIVGEAAIGFWDEFITTSKATGKVDYEQLIVLTSKRLGDIETQQSVEVLAEAAGIIAKNNLARTLRRPAPKKRP